MTAYTFQQLIDFTRTSAGTFVGSNGLIQNTPQSLNLLTFTQEFDNAAWLKTASTITANTVTAPDGTPTADTFTTAVTTSPHQVANATGMGVAFLAGVTYATSIYVKAGTSSFVQIYMATTPFGVDAFANFDLATGTLGTVGSAATASIQAVGNGWYRCSVVATATAAATGASARVNFAMLTTATAIRAESWTGTGTETLFVWGAQLEAASTVSAYTRNVGGLFPPRFDYDPVTLAPRGILIEEQRVNLTLQSENFTVSPWAAAVTGTSTRVNDNTALGFMRGLITATSVNGGIRQTYSSLSSGQVYALSFYIQSASTSVAISLENGLATYGTQCDVTINPAAGTFGALVGFTSARVTPFSSGYIYEIMLPAAGGTLTANIEWRIPTNGNSILYGRPQFEAGAFATSYIPTVASQVTRTADQASIVAPMFAPWFNAAAGTFVAEFDKLTASARGIVVNAGNTASAGSGSSVAVDGQNDGFVRAFIENVGSVEMVNATLATYTANTPIKGAVTYATNNGVGAAAGNVGTTDTSVVVPPMDALQIGAGRNNSLPASVFLNGHLRRITYYPTRLSNAQLQALTA